MEPIDGEPLLLDGVDELQHRVVAVLLQLGVIHGGALIAQGPLGQQGGAAGEHGVVVHDPGQGVAPQQEQVDVAAVRLPVGVPGPVIALLLAHVEHGLVEVVVEQAHGLPGGPAQADVEGDVLIEGVHLLRIVAHGVGGPLAEELLVLVERPRLLAEAVEAVVLLHPAVVGHPAVGVQGEGVARQVLIEQRALLVVEPEGDRVLVHFKAELASVEHQGLVPLGELGLDGLEAGTLLLEQGVQPVLPGGGGQHVGLLRQLLVEGGADADDLVGDKVELDVGAVGVQQEGALQALQPGDGGTDLHGDVTPVKSNIERGWPSAGNG